MSEFSSWGGYPSVNQQGLYLNHRRDVLPQSSDNLLPYGLGRSYGDSCLNATGKVLSSKLLKNFIAFDNNTGLLRCEAGVTLAEIIDVCLPQGWFLPVTPGTKYVTVGGAIGNDVHGKNHHLTGSFGNHVTQFELLRSDGKRLLCSPSENADWFAATIGGLGLTGFIVWAEIQLKPVISQSIDTETIKYKSLDEFFTISNDSVEKFEYTVAWLDCLASGSSLGKGHFIRGNHSSYKDIDPAKPLLKKNKLTVPIKPPVSCINALTLRAFNKLYYERQTQERVLTSVNYDPFFYPLDGILHWNRIYGRNGFIQHQCVIPLTDAKDGIREMLQCISAAGLGSFLVVLKMMGDVPSRGLLSFPQEGATLAIDFPYQGKKTLALLSRLDEVVNEAKGKIYPAKDARMSAKLFQQAYPQWKTVESLRDPNINSDFWRRVTGVNV
jgi:FAD/FMN-containing dehydrogenase